MLRKPANDQEDIVGLLPTIRDLRRAFDSAFPWAADTGSASGDGTSGGTSGGDPGSGNGGDGGAGSGDAGSGDSGAGSQGDDTGSAGDIKDPEKKRLADEAAEWRRKLREQEQTNNQLAQKLREFEDANKSELEKAQRDATEYKAKAEKAEAQLKRQAVRLAFFESGSAALFKNAGLALRSLDLDGIAPDDEGNVDSKAIRAQADALLKEHPYLAADETGSGTAGDDGSPSGKPNNGRKSKDQVDYEALAKKFPALRR